MIKNKANETIEMHTTMSVHGVNKISIENIKDLTGCFTRIIRVDTGNGYLELTCFSDVEETLKIKSVVKTEVHNINSKEVRI